MKQRYRFIVAAVVTMLLGVVSLGAFTGVQASDFRTGNSVSVQKNEVINSSVYAAGSAVTIDGTINGDVYCAGQTVTINATVNGDVLCAGMSLTLNGKVNGDVRLAGQTVSLQNTVTGSASLVGATVNFGDKATVQRDVTATGDVLDMRGTIGRDLVVGARAVTLGGTIGRDVTASLDEIAFAKNASIKGSLHYQSERQLTIDDGVVAGKTTFSEQATEGTTPTMADWLFGLVMMIAGLVLATVLASLVAPRALRSATQLSVPKLFVCLLIGLGILVMTPLVAILLMVSIVGLWAGLILLILWVALLALSPIVTAFWLGKILLSGGEGKPALLLALVGGASAALLFWVPLIGSFMLFVALVAGSGMIVYGVVASQQTKPETPAVKSPVKRKK